MNNSKGIIAYAKKLENLAEQISKSSEDYMTEVADCWDLGDELTESMLDRINDKHRALQSAIYEFRKRVVPNAELTRAQLDAIKNRDASGRRVE